MKGFSKMREFRSSNPFSMTLSHRAFCLLKCIAYRFCQLFHRSCSPVVEEEDPRLFIEHVIVNSGYINSSFSQRPNDFVDF